MGKNSKFQRRHYEEIADLLKSEFDNGNIMVETVNEFSLMFARDNGNFNRIKFLERALKGK